MKSYDSIDYYGEHWGLPIFAFDKLDGSNLRFEWNKKRGFYKFGTKKMIIDENHPDFGDGVKTFLEKYSEPLNKLFKDDKKYRNVLSFVAFAEYYGANSAFGKHTPGEKKEVTIFDISLYKKGLLAPRDFIDDFEKFGIPEVVYTGNLNKEFVQMVKENDFEPKLTEGVICKGVTSTKKGNDILYYCKIKTNDWFDRLRAQGDPDSITEEMKQSQKWRERY